MAKPAADLGAAMACAQADAIEAPPLRHDGGSG